MATTETIVGYPKGIVRIVTPEDEGIMVPSPYTRFFARNCPDLRMLGREFYDVGTGGGTIAIVAAKMGAQLVLASDINPAFRDATLYNARINDCLDQVKLLDAGNLMDPAKGRKVDGILFNPSSLPMKTPGPEIYYAGAEGREMIDEIMTFSKFRLNPSGGLLLVHTSLANPFRTQSSRLHGGFYDYDYIVRATEEIPFRDFYDKAWIDQLDKDWITWVRNTYQGFRNMSLEQLWSLGISLHRVDKDGTYYERLNLIQAGRYDYETYRDPYGNQLSRLKPNFLYQPPIQ